MWGSRVGGNGVKSRPHALPAQTAAIPTPAAPSHLPNLQATDPDLISHYASTLLTPSEAAAAAAAADSGRPAAPAVLARALTRATLAKYVPGCADPRALALAPGPSGKPGLVGWDAGWARPGDLGRWASAAANPLCPSLAPPPPALEFNLTHTSGLLGLAVSAPGWAVGLDAEATTRPAGADGARALALARRYFSAAEVEALEGEGEVVCVVVCGRVGGGCVCGRWPRWRVPPPSTRRPPRRDHPPAQFFLHPPQLFPPAPPGGRNSCGSGP